MVKQQNLEKWPNFLKRFLRILRKISKNSAKNHENFLMKLELSFTLNSFKIPYKSSDFSVKILNFLRRSGGFAPPRAPNMLQVLNYYLLSWGPTPEFQEKTTMAKENLGKKSQRFGVRGLRPRTPWWDRIFRYSQIFDQILSKNPYIF